MNAATTKPIRHRPFQGVAQIMRFNWPQYVGAAVVVLIAGSIVFAGNAFPDWAIGAAICVTLVTIWWTVSSLVVSWWVYDLSELMHWEWLKCELPGIPQHWLNLHAGLDEGTESLRNLWPEAKGETGDIFSATEMTEKSIHRARSESDSQTSKVDYRKLPYGNGQFDSIFVIFAAHELREATSRQILFIEINRVLTPDGCVVLVEHLRDGANFIAFGPGFMHFHSHRTWLTDFETAGFNLAHEFPKTPFVRAFILRKQT